MKAIVATRIGGPEVLELQDVPGPQPKDNQILVNVEACGVNFADIMMSQGSYAVDPRHRSSSDGNSPGASWPRASA